MKSKLLLILGLSAALFFASCSSDNNSTNPTPSGDFYNFKTGNFWVYNVSTINPDSDEETVTRDSSVIVGQEMKFGKNAFKFTKYSNNEQSGDLYQYSENAVLYGLLSSLMPSGEMGIPTTQVEDTWIKMADPNASGKWDIYTLNLAEVPLDLGGINLKFSGTIKFDGMKGEKKIVNVLNKDYTAQKYTINANINISATFSGIPLPIVATIPTHFYYVDGIGLVRTQTESVAINLIATTYNTPSSESLLINYNVTK